MHLPGQSGIIRALVVASVLLMQACGPDEAPLKAENEQLRKQIAKQESVITSIQEGTKVMQQQIDLLNRELRDSKKEAERIEAERAEMASRLEAESKILGGKLESERKTLTSKLDAERKSLQAKLEVERKTLSAQLGAEANEKRQLAAETKRLTEQLARAVPIIHVEEKGGQTSDFPQSLFSIGKAVEETLSRNGYSIRVSLRTEQRAIYLTERKVSAPASLEVGGFRNQYLLTLQALTAGGTRIMVKADFEKLAQGGKILAVSAEELAEIERRLIGEIGKAAGAPGKS